MPNLKRVTQLAIAVLIAQVILTMYLYPIIGKETQTLFSIQPQTGIGSTNIGDSIIGYVSGFFSFDLSNIGVILAMLVGTFVLVWAGFWLYEQRSFKLPQGKNLTQRLFYILLYGHVVLYVVLLLMKSSVPGIAVNLLIGLAVNLVLVSTLVTLSANNLKYPRV